MLLEILFVGLATLLSTVSLEIADLNNNPGGHCEADATTASDNQEASIAQCEELHDELESHYGIDITGSWTLSELAIVQLALADLESGFGGLANFERALDAYEIRREPFYSHAEDGKLAMGQSEYFVIWDQAFDLRSESARFTILHEAFHTLDMRRRWQISEDFRQAVGGVDDNPNTPDPGDYSPAEGHEWSQYASANINEDAAESFAAAMFGGDWDALLVQDPRITRNPTVNYNDGGRTQFMQQNALEW